MKTALTLVLVLAGIVSSQEKKTDEPQTVPFVDLKSYAGLWYEIARIPNRFQKNCTGNTTAEYSLREDGRINVTNSCDEEDGKRNVATGIARIVEESTNSKLEVSFFSILGIRPFWGDYWIIGLDKDYQYAVIGSPDRKYGWILSRTPKLPAEKLNEAWEILKKQGYDPKSFQITRQDK
ncbi:MAG: lipocalin family protein [Bacteroidota bacterium]|jgi:apolipoprotein D and lipocalin family protein|nr:lipocalin family protein [Ignavibacteria bacterium]MCU7498363.1 lipocalin family protein [Ignavibacteria bacterium]MCU7512878.1 lipocalin family protein [Ignavibacteria bacterium]MCU7520257.1 lipocalin family protein [Ignavibacteria bacterium]MCU7523622.1 lipocalin family protein [Ignavibacteria bacterium]